MRITFLLKRKIVAKIVLIGLILIKGHVVFGGTKTPTKYQLYGMQELDFLINNYYIPSSGLYAGSIDGTTLQKSTTSYIWPAAHLLKALLLGTMIDSKYDAPLQSYVDKISWYVNGPGYGCTKNGQRFFDDNALIGGTLMDIYQKGIRTQSVLNKSLFALNYCLDNIDENWGLPQTQPDLGKGIFLLGVACSSASTCSTLYELTANVDDFNIAKTYYDMVTDPIRKMQNQKTLLFINGSNYNDSTGLWTAQSVGPRAANTCGVALLGLRLYNLTGEARYLNDAKAMGDACLKKWYKPGGGFGEISFWGGSASIYLLCELYNADRDIKWYNAAKDIVDFLIDHGRDKSGFYPEGSENTNGRWDLDRTAYNPPTDVGLISQACAANAILRFAYLDLNKDVSAIPSVPNAENSLVIYPNPVSDILNIQSSLSDLNVEIYSTLGQKIIQSKEKQIDVSRLVSGIYNIVARSDGRVYKTMFIKK